MKIKTHVRINFSELLGIFLIFLSVVFIIIYSFFSSGKLISNSEESLNFYNLKKAANLYLSAWYEVDTGKKNPFNLTKYPSFIFLSNLESLKVPNYLIQALFLAIWMLVGLSSAYCLSRLVLKFSSFTSLIFALFYLLNLFTLSQVWRRFLYSGIAIWAYLPFFLLCWIKIVEERSFKWLGFFLIGSLFFVLAFAHPAHLLTVWLPALIFILVKIIQQRRLRLEVFKIALVAGTSILLWFLLHSWWIAPVLNSSTSYITTNRLAGNFNFDLLMGVSKHFSTSEILLLRQAWWFGPDNHWYSFYSNPLIYSISIVILVLSLVGWYKLKGHKYWIYLTALILVGWFISKGTNPPFGEIFFNWLFNTFPFLGALRNSYEKFGLVFLLPYSAFFVYGFSKITENLKIKPKLILRSFLLVLFLVILVWPMWTGKIYLEHEYVSVPFNYKYTNQILNSAGSERILHLPYLKFGNVKYAWGYTGQNPNEYLFDRQSISGTIDIKLFDDYILIAEKFSNSADFLKVMGLIGVENVILHKDITEGAQDLTPVLNNLKVWRGISEEKDTEEMTIFTLNENFLKSRIYVASKVGKVSSLEEGFEKILNDQFKEFVFWDNLQSFQNPNKAPQISFVKESNDLYSVKIKNATEPFILVLNNTYDDGWKAFIRNEKAYEKSFLIDKHFLINGLMNGWLIEEKGDLLIEIKF